MSTTIIIRDECDDRGFNGTAVRMGAPSDEEGETWSNQAAEYLYKAYASVSNWYHQSRSLYRVDLSAIPRNSKIVSAKFRLYVTVGYDPVPSIPSPLPITCYKAEAKPWQLDATARYYDPNLEWDDYLMNPNVDYYAVSPISDIQYFTLPYSSWSPLNDFKYWDMTDFIQDCIDRDDMTANFVMKVEEAYEWANMYGVWQSYGNGGGQIEARGTAYSDVSQRPALIVEYTEPMAFFASDAVGDINEDRQIFLGAGQYRIGTVVHDPEDESYQETPAKLWLKNMLATVTMRGVEILSPPNWATFPDADDGNTGNGTCSDVGTSPTSTIDEQWEIRLTGATDFSVYRDSGTGDDPGQSQSWTLDGTGTVGTLYTSGTRGITFTLTAGGTAFINGDLFAFRSYKDYSISGAPSDSDQLLQICADTAGSPDGNWIHARTAMTSLTAQVVSSNVLSVNDATYFNPSNKVKIFWKASESWSAQYTVQSVNRDTNTVTLQENISAEIGDWLHAVPLTVGDMIALDTEPFWARGMSFATTTKEEKEQYLRARETI